MISEGIKKVGSIQQECLNEGLKLRRGLHWNFKTNVIREMDQNMKSFQDFKENLSNEFKIASTKYREYLN